MALVQCVECGHEISGQAKACPKCGAPQAKKSGGSLPIILLLIALAVVAFLILGALGSRHERTYDTRSYTGHLRIDAGTEYVMEDSPSPIRGACDGWNAVSVQKPGQPEGGIRSLMCWRRNGSNIETQDASGGNFRSDPDVTISD